MRKTQYRLVKTRKNSYRPVSKYTHKDRAKEMGFILFFLYTQNKLFVTKFHKKHSFSIFLTE